MQKNSFEKKKGKTMSEALMNLLKPPKKYPDVGLHKPLIMSLYYILMPLVTAALVVVGGYFGYHQKIISEKMVNSSKEMANTSAEMSKTSNEMAKFSKEISKISLRTNTGHPILVAHFKLVIEDFLNSVNVNINDCLERNGRLIRAIKVSEKSNGWFQIQGEKNIRNQSIIKIIKEKEIWISWAYSKAGDFDINDIPKCPNNYNLQIWFRNCPNNGEESATKGASNQIIDDIDNIDVEIENLDWNLATKIGRGIYLVLSPLANLKKSDLEGLKLNECKEFKFLPRCNR